MCAHCKLPVGNAEGVYRGGLLWHPYCFEVFRKMVKAALEAETMRHEQVQYTLGGQRAGRTAEIYRMLMSKALAAIDDGLDEYVVLLVRPGSIVRITFEKEPPPAVQPEPTLYVFDDVPGVIYDPR